jgi:chromosome segregation ATPase
MAGFFKKALSVFVEFDDEHKSETNTPEFSNIPKLTSEVAQNPLNHSEAEKFEKYFDNLFDKANFPGPDYYEFYKTMETLEAHIPDEKTRVSATFASLAIQGLTKQKLLDTAAQYKVIIEQDHANFENALHAKLKTELGDRKNQLLSLEQKIASNAELIQKLNKEMSEANIQIGQVKNEILEQENKLGRNKNGYQVACQAVLNKISSDIQKIQSTL